MTDIDKIGKCARCGRAQTGRRIIPMNEKYCDECAEILLNEMVERMKANDSIWEIRQEFGRLLQKHINDLTPAEIKRYYELKETLETY